MENSKIKRKYIKKPKPKSPPVSKEIIVKFERTNIFLYI